MTSEEILAVADRLDTLYESTDCGGYPSCLVDAAALLRTLAEVQEQRDEARALAHRMRSMAEGIVAEHKFAYVPREERQGRDGR